MNRLRLSWVKWNYSLFFISFPILCGYLFKCEQYKRRHCRLNLCTIVAVPPSLSQRKLRTSLIGFATARVMLSANKRPTARGRGDVSSTTSDPESPACLKYAARCCTRQVCPYLFKKCRLLISKDRRGLENRIGRPFVNGILEFSKSLSAKILHSFIRSYNVTTVLQ
jgi:hypothetical protein